jgi:hypothetical protein
VIQDLPNDARSTDSSQDVQPLVYFAVGAAWAVVALGLWRQARHEEARRKVRVVSSRLLSQVFPYGSRL